MTRLSIPVIHMPQKVHYSITTAISLHIRSISLSGLVSLPDNTTVIEGHSFIKKMTVNYGAVPLGVF